MHRRSRHLNVAGFGAANVYDARFIQQADNTSVATWSNRVSPGTKDATMSNVSFRPVLKTTGINGTAAIYFDGSKFLSMDLTNLGDLEIYIVGSHAAKAWTGDYNNNLQAYIDQNHSGSVGFVIQTRPDLSSTLVQWSANPQSNAVSYNITAGTVNLITATRLLAGNATGYLNGGNLSTGTNAQQWMKTNIQSIGRWSANSRYLVGHIGTLVIFEKINSAAVRKRIEQTLARSFKLQCS